MGSSNPLDLVLNCLLVSLPSWDFLQGLAGLSLDSNTSYKLRKQNLRNSICFPPWTPASKNSPSFLAPMSTVKALTHLFNQGKSGGLFPGAEGWPVLLDPLPTGTSSFRLTANQRWVMFYSPHLERVRNMPQVTQQEEVSWGCH